jgi:hypothetical protein
MAWGIAQATGNHVGTTNTGTSKAFASNVQAGSVLIAGTDWNSAAGSGSISDTFGMTWTLVNRRNSGFVTASTEIWVSPVVATGGACTVTSTTPSTSQGDLAIYEVTGISPVSPIGAGNEATGSNVTVPIVPPMNDAFIVAMLVDTGTPAPTAGYTLRVTNSAISISFTKNDPTTGGSSITVTETGGSSGVMSVGAFSLSGGLPFVPHRMPLGV